MSKPYGLLKLRETLVVKEATRRSMQGNRATETKPEQLLRKALWNLGLRGYRKNVRTLPGHPDVLFPRDRLAIFVHGCFWHGCPKCRREAALKTNATYWLAKIHTNQERDERNLQSLRDQEIEPLVIWECELKNDLAAAVGRILERLGGEPPSEDAEKEKGA
jgi:DNA mismatch endonuclease, patch repair protein